MTQTTGRALLDRSKDQHLIHLPHYWEETRSVLGTKGKAIKGAAGKQS